MNRSFLKYAGSKAKSVPFLLKHLPKGKRLIEPFVGSGSVFLNTDYEEYILGDINPDIINVFSWLKNSQKGFIADLQAYFCPENNTLERYNLYRQQFNMTGLNEYERALLFVYLNRHCFNGLCRYNSSGHFNVPFGKYDVPYFPQKELGFFIEKSYNATFVCSDFEETLSWVQPDDVVYCDPPFLSLQNKSAVGLYTHEFTLANHKSLFAICKNLDAPCFISNHDTPVIRSLYEDYPIETNIVRRTISANTKERNLVSEILVKIF